MSTLLQNLGALESCASLRARFPKHILHRTSVEHGECQIELPLDTQAAQALLDAVTSVGRSSALGLRNLGGYLMKEWFLARSFLEIRANYVRKKKESGFFASTIIPIRAGHHGW